MKAEI